MEITEKETSAKVEKISLSELKQEADNMKREEEQAAFQSSVENLFYNLVKNLEDIPPEVIDECLDELEQELEKKHKTTDTESEN